MVCVCEELCVCVRFILCVKDNFGSQNSSLFTWSLCPCVCAHGSLGRILESEFLFVGKYFSRKIRSVLNVTCYCLCTKAQLTLGGTVFRVFFWRSTLSVHAQICLVLVPSNHCSLLTDLLLAEGPSGVMRCAAFFVGQLSKKYGTSVKGGMVGFLGRARRSRDSLFESCTCRRHGPPHPPPAGLTPLGRTPAGLTPCHVTAGPLGL